MKRDVALGVERAPATLRRQSFHRNFPTSSEVGLKLSERSIWRQQSDIPQKSFRRWCLEDLWTGRKGCPAQNRNRGLNLTVEEEMSAEM